MSTHINSNQSAAIASLKRAVRGMDKYPKGSTRHTSANAEYQAAFNSLYRSGMRSGDILRLVNVDVSTGGKK